MCQYLTEFLYWKFYRRWMEWLISKTSKQITKTQKLYNYSIKWILQKFKNWWRSEEIVNNLEQTSIEPRVCRAVRDSKKLSCTLVGSKRCLRTLTNKENSYSKLILNIWIKVIIGVSRKRKEVMMQSQLVRANLIAGSTTSLQNLQQGSCLRILQASRVISSLTLA